MYFLVLRAVECPNLEALAELLRDCYEIEVAPLILLDVNLDKPS